MRSMSTLFQSNGCSEMCSITPARLDRLQLEVLRHERHGREAARAVRLEPHGLVLERRHVRERDRFTRAADERMELVVDVGTHLGRERRERRCLQQVAVLRVLLDDDDDPELQLLVRRHDRAAIEVGGLVHLAQRRAATVLAPEVEDEGPDAQRVLGEVEGGNVLRHGRRLGPDVHAKTGSRCSVTVQSRRTRGSDRTCGGTTGRGSPPRRCRRTT